MDRREDVRWEELPPSLDAVQPVCKKISDLWRYCQFWLFIREQVPDKAVLPFWPNPFDIVNKIWKTKTKNPPTLHLTPPFVGIHYRQFKEWIPRLHYTTLSYTILLCTTLHYTTLHYTILYYTTLHYLKCRLYTTLYYSIYSTLHSTSLYYTTTQ